jgi:hypothetical protein
MNMALPGFIKAPHASLRFVFEVLGPLGAVWCSSLLVRRQFPTPAYKSATKVYKEKFPERQEGVKYMEIPPGLFDDEEDS